MLVGTGELVEQGGLTAVLVASQRKGEGPVLGQGILPLFNVVFSALAKAGVIHHFIICRSRRYCRGLFGGGDADLRGIVQPEGQLIAMDAQLHGVAHGCQLDQRDLRPRDQAHIQKMLAQCAAAADGIHNSAFSDLQFF